LTAVFALVVAIAGGVERRRWQLWGDLLQQDYLL